MFRQKDNPRRIEVRGTTMQRRRRRAGNAWRFCGFLRLCQFRIRLRRQIDSLMRRDMRHKCLGRHRLDRWGRTHFRLGSSIAANVGIGRRCGSRGCDSTVPFAERWGIGQGGGGVSRVGDCNVAADPFPDLRVQEDVGKDADCRNHNNRQNHRLSSHFDRACVSTSREKREAARLLRNYLRKHTPRWPRTHRETRGA